MREAVTDFDLVWKGHAVTFHDVPALKCEKCGYTVYRSQVIDLMSDFVDAKIAANQEVPEVMTVEEAAAFLKVSEQTIYSLCKLGQIPSAKVGNQLRVLKQSLMDLLSNKPAPSATTATPATPATAPTEGSEGSRNGT